MIFGGDGRGPSVAPPARTVPAGTLEPYRLEGSLLLEVPSDLAALRLLGSPDFSAGLTTQFHKATTLGDGVVDDNDYDKEGDCDRLHQTGRLGGMPGSATVSGRALAMELAGANPLVFPRVQINASLDLDLRRSATGDLVIDGEIAHDCMPAFELYIDGVAAYEWAPSSATLGSASRIAWCLARKNQRGRFECTENSQGVFTCRER
jgi:hypothetical protein